MLLRTAVLERIVRGEISLVFRRWRRPTVRAGGTLRTALGVLRILEVDPVAEADISEADAGRAGFSSRAALLDGLGSREGQVYRIAVEYAGADPRIALRQQDDLSDAEIEQIAGRLERLDARSPAGPWTARVLAFASRDRSTARCLCPDARRGAGMREGLAEAQREKAEEPRADGQPHGRLRALGARPDRAAAPAPHRRWRRLATRHRDMQGAGQRFAGR